MENNTEKLDHIFYKVLQIRTKEIEETLSLETLPAFDSFNVLMLFTELEQAFGVTFDSDELRASKTLKNIKEFLQKKGIQL